MSTSKVFSGATLVSIPLGALILLIWIAQLATLADLNGSDPAGNALAQAYGAAEIIVLWVLLAVLTIVARTKGCDAGSSGSRGTYPDSRVGACGDNGGGTAGRTGRCAVHVAHHPF